MTVDDPALTFRDLSHLPSSTEPEGLTPDEDTTFVRVLVDQLAEQPRKPQVSDTLTRHSSAASCLKRVALLRDGVEPEPMDLAGHHVTNIGTLVHEAYQAAVAKQYPDAQFEVGTTIEDLTSGSCDVVIDVGPDGNSVPIRLAPVRGENRDERHDGRVLAVEGGDEQGGGVPGLPRQQGDGPARGASGEPLRVHGSDDPGGDDGRPPLQDAAVREPRTPAGGDAAGERSGLLDVGERAQRGQDALPDGSPVRGSEPQGEGAEVRPDEGVRDVRAGAPASSAPAPRDAGVERHVIELKTTGGFAYRLMVGERGAAQGPKSAHMVQLALNVMGLDAGKGTLVYLSNEAISKGVAERKGFDEVTRFGAQWTFDRATLQPLADEWLEQLRWVRDHPTEEVPRFVPHEMMKGARLNPETSAWTLERDGQVIDTGQVWGGAYCSYCPVAEECRKQYAEEMGRPKELSEDAAARGEDGVCVICRAPRSSPHDRRRHDDNDAAEDATWD